MGKRKFGYEGKPLTCLWCGKKFAEDYKSVWTRQVGAGDLELLSAGTGGLVDWGHEKLKVREVVPFMTGHTYPDERKGETKKERKARPGETPDFYKLYLDPPQYKATYGLPTGKTETSDFIPMFDTQGCAARFGIRQAELGHRLQKKEKS